MKKLKLPESLSSALTSRPNLFIALIITVAVVLTPMTILQYGFTPPDDALRHVASVVSGRSWTEVVVTNPDLKVIDTTPGWHAFLTAVRGVTGAGKYALLAFSVIILFAVLLVPPLFYLERPEAWIIASLTVLLLEYRYVERILLGRPYLFTISVVIFMLFMWNRLIDKAGDKRPSYLIITLLVALATWMHSTYFIFAIPLFAAFLTGHFRPAFHLALSVAAGVVMGAILTLHPIDYLYYQIAHAFVSVSVDVSARVGELQPYLGNSYLYLLVFFLVILIPALPEKKALTIRHPAFYTMIIAWLLCFKVVRFWTDLGLPALMVWLTLTLQALLVSRVGFASLMRYAGALFFAVAFFLGMTSNVGTRWEKINLAKTVYLEQHPDRVRAWLPGPGGIVYSPNMSVFYCFYFTYPDAPWKYILGPEKAIIPKEDLTVVTDFLRTNNWASIEPWVRKMRPEDRLILPLAPPDQMPRFEDIEVFTVPRSFWIGRVKSTR